MSNIPRSRWSAPTHDAEAYARAGGRRHYNAWRRFMRIQRQIQVCDLIFSAPWSRGVFSRVARALGVHRSTVCRDWKEIMRRHWEEQEKQAREREALAWYNSLPSEQQLRIDEELQARRQQEKAWRHLRKMARQAERRLQEVGLTHSGLTPTLQNK